jgi:arylformamidase
VDRIPLDTLIGPCRVLDLQGIQAITPEKLSHFALRDVSRILLKTDNSRWVATGPMPDLPAHLTEDAAHHLVERNVALLGFDGLSVDHPSAPVAHAVLLDAGVIILETIDLTDIAPGDYHLTCLPLRIAGADGAPARATLQPL